MAKKFKHPGRQRDPDVEFSGFGRQISSQLASAGRAYFSGAPMIRRPTISRLKVSSVTPGPGSNESHASTLAFGPQVSSVKPSRQQFPLDGSTRECNAYDVPDGRSPAPRRDYAGLGRQKLSPLRSAPQFTFSTSSRF